MYPGSFVSALRNNEFIPGPQWQAIIPQTTASSSLQVAYETTCDGLSNWNDFETEKTRSVWMTMAAAGLGALTVSDLVCSRFSSIWYISLSLESMTALAASAHWVRNWHNQRQHLDNTHKRVQECVGESLNDLPQSSYSLVSGIIAIDPATVPVHALTRLEYQGVTIGLAYKSRLQSSRGAEAEGIVVISWSNAIDKGGAAVPTCVYHTLSDEHGAILRQLSRSVV